eukprot:TRINITY_DN8998_c0_g1_i3.p2 TRINITY_DN8998_c0_g1~~TRINITY_DN8998_c0_g1_i3.p2  ORF type:complete len:158 (-),score=46.75 TRINITY_DN8998_c0_g1_i3:268-741(-)
MMVDFLALGHSDPSKFPSSLFHWEILGWGLVISWYLLRFMVLGSRINSKYRDTSALLTEQINVQLRILQHISNSQQRTAGSGKGKESKKERLQISGNVLKLASELLKSQHNSPHKISGLSMNPFLYNATRIVLLSALSAVLSELCGFNIRLWKLVKA